MPKGATPKDPSPFFEGVARRVEEASRLLFTESDRGCVLVAGAMLDEALGALLQAFLVHDETLAKEIFDLPGATLSTFSSRLRLCRALGLITDQLYRDLDRVRLVRNTAAHFDRKGDRAAAFSFTDADVTDRCRAITTIPAEVRALPPRVVFIAFVGMVAALFAEHAANAAIVRHHAGQRHAMAMLLERTPAIPFEKYLRRMTPTKAASPTKPTRKPALSRTQK